MQTRPPGARMLLLLLIAAGGHAALAHEHGEHGAGLPGGKAISAEPLDPILWWHIFLMITAFGIMLPIGMVLGLVRSRYHVPLQIATTLIAITAVFLGHAHGGRQFARNIHASFASSLLWMLGSQVGLGIYLKMHLERGFHGKIRLFALAFHSIIGKLLPVVSWVQMLFGGITALGFCRKDHLGQCLAHFIMGSGFIGYGIVLTIMLLAGQAWLKRTGKSQEFWDSLVIAAWGCVNTFTEHRWGQEWNHGDIDHTSMGVVWWCAGLLGLWLSRGRGGEPKRNIIPGIVIFLTGWAMAGHVQHLPLATMIHAAFGYTLMAAGVSRIIEICFVLKDKPSSDDPMAFQHLTPFLLFASGFIFMSATEEQLALIASAGIGHVPYLLVIYSLAFLVYLFVQVLLHLFVSGSAVQKKPEITLEEGRPREAEGRVQDAEEFELEGLISDDDTEAAASPYKP